MSVDPYLLDGGDVLRNLIGATYRDRLRAAEDDLVSVRSYEIAEDLELPGEYGWPLLSAIHGYLFQDVYDWAGRPRTVDISKVGGQFTPHGQIAAELERFAESLAASAQTRTREEFIAELARRYEQLNHIHPFREG